MYISKIRDLKELFGYIAMWKYRNSHQRCSMKERILRNFAKFTGKHQCQSLVPWQKGTLAQVFSYEVCKISKNTFFTEHLRRLLPKINLSSQKNKWVSNSKGFLIRSQSLLSFLFKKVITYTIMVLSRKIFKQISEVLCNRVHDIC